MTVITKNKQNKIKLNIPKDNCMSFSVLEIKKLSFMKNK